MNVNEKQDLIKILTEQLAKQSVEIKNVEISAGISEAADYETGCRVCRHNGYSTITIKIYDAALDKREELNRYSEHKEGRK